MSSLPSTGSLSLPGWKQELQIKIARPGISLSLDILVEGVNEN